MSAIDEVLRLLDERGAECKKWPGIVEWGGENGRVCRAYQRHEPLTVDVTMMAVPPEQAIEATLGRGECRKLPPSGDAVCIVRRHGYEMEFGYWRCSECGCECFEGARYCMGCGRKVRA